MGRERQKRKNRSSIAKVRQKPKSKKRVLQNPIIAANWDKTQSTTQNYKRLGLTARLNKVTGGVERKVSDVVREANEGEVKGDALNVAAARRPEKIDLSEARIERDPDTGRILRIIDAPGVAKPNPLNDPLNDLEFDSEAEDGFDQHGKLLGISKLSSAPAKTAVVEQLEEHASHAAPKYKRRQTEGEQAFIQELVQKYGDDYMAMARDIKINYMQRSEGDLKRRVKKWREAGGTTD